MDVTDRAIPKQLVLTKHARKRSRQRVGNIPQRALQGRLQTALICGLYKIDGTLIRLCGIWWAFTTDGSNTILTTCLGRGKEGERFWSG